MALIALVFPIKANANELQETYNPQPQLTQEEYAKIQEQEWSRELVAWFESHTGGYGGECLIFVRNFTGISRDQGQGVAANLKTTPQPPKIGAIGKTNESKSGHAFIVIAETDTMIRIGESNYKWNKRISTRWIPKNSKIIKGYLIYT